LDMARVYYLVMTKSETAILESKTPEEYIDRSLKVRLSPAAKAKLARMWMESKGYTKEDILRARNRHPYWKRKKMEGSAERTRRRLAAHDYSEGRAVEWNTKLVGEFLVNNDRDASGRYQRKDWELAERFGATIPSIQYMRRKLRKVQAILGPRAPAAKVVEYLLRAESVLSRGRAAVEGLKSAEMDRETAARKPAPKAKKAPTAAKKTAKKATKKAAPAAIKVAKKVAPGAKKAAKKPAKKSARTVATVKRPAAVKKAPAKKPTKKK
jgi:hypothetical protein